jgi:hypothetical protein
MKQLSTIATITLLLLSMAGCKGKKKDKDAAFFPVLSFIKSQVADIDTSVYSIRKLDFIDTSRTDTSYIPREQFREVANEFLSIPDLSSAAYEDRYTEKEQFDQTTNRVIISYTPNKPEKEEIQGQEVLIKPDVAAGDKVTNIIINRVMNSKDSSVQKRLMWTVDKSFQVTTIKQLPGQPETTSTYKVIWSDEQ